METDQLLPQALQLKYLRSRKDELSQALHDDFNSDLKALKTMVHKMRGNAATFGFPTLGKIAGEVEDLLTNESSTDPRPALGRLRQELESLWSQQEL